MIQFNVSLHSDKCINNLYKKKKLPQMKILKYKSEKHAFFNSWNKKASLFEGIKGAKLTNE